MTERPVPRTTRRRLVTVVAVVVVTVILLASPFVLLGRTTARVSDSEQLGPNHLGAATLDLAVGARTADLVVDRLAAGDRRYGFVDLRNSGDLPLAFEVTSTGDRSPLAAGLQLAVWPNDTICNSPPAPGRSDVRRVQGLGGPGGVTVVGSPGPGVQHDVALAPGASSGWCIEVHLPLTAGNELQGQTTRQALRADAVHVVDPDTLTTDLCC